MAHVKYPESDYCKEMNKLFLTIQDDGLIFASGDKEDLSSSHGRVNCTNRLLSTYLKKGMVLSKERRRVYSKKLFPQEPLISLICKSSPSLDSKEEAGGVGTF